MYTPACGKIKKLAFIDKTGQFQFENMKCEICRVAAFIITEWALEY